MLKNKKLMMFLAFNSVIGAVSSSNNSELTKKYENLHKKMTKNLDENRSNSVNYKLLEKVLNQRNRELKDLYLQSDYILKPEYLEWQILFSGFYNQKDRKGTKIREEITSFSTANTIDVSIKMSDIYMTDPNINLEKVSVGTPAVNINKNSTAVPDVSYNTNVIVPEFIIPELPSITWTPPTFSVSASSMFSASSMQDKSFYNPSLGAIQIWNSGLFSNYNLEKGDYTYQGKVVGSTGNSITYNFNNAVGSIDPTAKVDASLNQPADIPESGSGSTSSVGVPMVVSTSSPKITIGEDVTINLVSSNTYSYSTPYLPALLQFVLNPNRSALNADTDYASGGSKAYPDAQANVPFSILRNNGTVNISGNKAIAGLLMTSSNQSGSRNDYLLVNDGVIIGDYSGTNSSEQYGLVFQGTVSAGTKGERYILGNDGKMEFRASQSAAFTMGGVNIEKYQTIYNRGTIDMYGSNNYGVKMSNATLGGANPGMNMVNSKILLESPININGDNSVGIYAQTYLMKLENSIFKINIGTEKNSYSGNISGNSADYVDNSVGIYLKPMAYGDTLKLVNYDFKFGDYAKNSILFLNDGSSNSYYMTGGTFSNPLTQVYMENSAVSSIDVDSGQNNIVFYNRGEIRNGSFKYIPVINIKPDINIGSAIKNVDNTIGIYNLSGIAHLWGNIDTYGEASHGVYNTADIKTFGGVQYVAGSELDNTIDGVSKAVSIITHGENSAALYNENSNINFSKGGTYKSLGENGTILYNKNGNINITGNAVFEADNRGTAVVSNGGHIKLEGNNTYNLKNNSVFAYALGKPGVKISFDGTASDRHTVNLESGSIGFVYDGNAVNMQQNSVYDYLNNNFSGLDKLDINISNNSRLFLFNNYGTLKLSEIQNMNTGTGLFGSITGNNNSLLNKGTMILDGSGTIDLDDPNDFYFNTDKAATGITVDSGVTVKGTHSGQTALSGKDIYRGTPGGNTYVIMNNNGSIELSGDNSLGIYTNNGIINNYSEVNVTGKNSAGLFGENSSVIANNGNVKMSDNGAGIYAVSYQNPNKPDEDFGNGLVDVTNTGIIRAETSEKAVGIYVNNNKINALRSTGTLNLAAGTVDMSLSKESTGVYAENISVNGGGTVNVGEMGTGLYAKNSDLNLNNLTLNMDKDNSVGIYLDSGSNLNSSGTNTVNVNGKKNTVFYVNTDGTFNQNFAINGDSNAEYTLMYMKNNKGMYNGSAVMSGNSTVFYGANASVELGNDAFLKAENGNTVGIYSDGVYSGTADYEGVNNGKMQFGDNSAGLYGVNGARMQNTGEITTGDMSLGLSSEGSDYLRNTGTVKTGKNSIGMSAKNVLLTENTGSITATGENVTGLYSKTDGISVVNNYGDIELLGQNTIGVYLDEGGQQTFLNTGSVITESSDNLSIASAGIYNSGHTVNNAGNITAGTGTVGIFNNNGVVNHSGEIISKGDGIGVYSSGGELNLVNGNMKSDNIGIYAENNTKIVNTGTKTDIGANSTAYVLKSGSSLENNTEVSIGNGSVYIYGNNAGDILNNGTSITMTGAQSTGYYLTNSGNIISNADITGLSTGNIGIYSNLGSITNSGNIVLGDSEIIDEKDSSKNRYSVGIYSEGAEVNNSGNIKVGNRGTAVYTENNKLTNSGEITSDGEYAVGLWGSKAVVENNGLITMSGNNSQGIAGTSQSTIINNSVITMNGNNSIGISGSEGTKIQNNGIINLNGNDSTGISLSNGASLLNKGIINLGSGSGNVSVGNGSSLTPPSIINAGVIKVDGKFELNGINVTIQVDPDTIRKPDINQIVTNQYIAEDLNAKFLISDAVQFQAESFDFSSPAMVDPSFTQGTNALVYKFENVFMAKDLASAESITTDSRSLTFKSMPVMNENGNIDIWMEKIPYQELTKGTHYDKMAQVLDKYYVLDGVLTGQTGDALVLYDKLDLITDTKNFENAMKDLSGEMYSNTTRRMEDVADIFSDSLKVLQNSSNNTKENIKINVIAGKGKTKENRNAVQSYDYENTGVTALREVERTYKHTFGYSLGYLRTDFQFEDTDNEETANTFQLGLHNKYKSDGWELRTDLLGRVGFNNTDREINWDSGSNSKMSGDYNTYGAALLNEVSKDLEIGKNTKIKPYAGLKLEYGYHTDISESGGAEKLKVDNNYYYSVKPNAGVELETAKYFGGNKDWKIKMNVGAGYEYELGETNRTESASLVNISNEKFNLGKSGEDKGKIVTNGGIGVEFQEKYGIFLTGKYKTAGNNEEDYQVGLNLKASF